jgi:hypothetical protein
MSVTMRRQICKLASANYSVYVVFCSTLNFMCLLHSSAPVVFTLFMKVIKNACKNYIAYVLSKYLLKNFSYFKTLNLK